MYWKILILYLKNVNQAFGKLEVCIVKSLTMH